MNIEKHRAFIDSLEGEKGLPEEMLGLRFDDKLSDAWDSKLDSYELSCYFAERARRAESRQIPDLKEKVKELVRDAMESERNVYETDGSIDFNDACAMSEAFTALCAEVKPWIHDRLCPLSRYD